MPLNNETHTYGTCTHKIKGNRLTCPPESFETGWTANDITGSGTFIEVIVYLTDPSVNVSPDDTRRHALEQIYERNKMRRKQEQSIKSLGYNASN